MADASLRAVERRHLADGDPESAYALERARARAQGFYPPARRLPDFVWQTHQRAHPEVYGVFLTNYPPGDPRALKDMLEGVFFVRPTRAAAFVTVEFVVDATPEPWLSPPGMSRRDVEEVLALYRAPSD